MKPKKIRHSRVSIKVTEHLDVALASLKGHPLRGLMCSRTLGENYGNDYARFLRNVLEEAIYAADDFASEHGFLPAQPRFEISVDADGTLRKPRRHERVAELGMIEGIMAAATKLCEKEGQT